MYLYKKNLQITQPQNILLFVNFYHNAQCIFIITIFSYRKII